MSVQFTEDRTRVFLVRHCRVAEKWHGRLYGGLDVELAEDGLEHSREIGRRLAAVDFDAIVSSDLQRAAYLADRIAAPSGLKVQRKAAFRERDFGEWSGMNWEGMKDKFPEQYEEFMADRTGCPCAEGENYVQVGARVFPELERIARANIGKTVAFVAHAGVLRVILGKALGIPNVRLFDFQIRFGAVCMIDYLSVADCGLEKPYVMLLNGSPEDAADLDRKTKLGTV